MKVNTGFGYFKNTNGEIVSKYILPEGEHPLNDDLTQHEVPNENMLNAIIVHKPPSPILSRKKQSRKDSNIWDILDAVIDGNTAVINDYNARRNDS